MTIRELQQRYHLQKDDFWELRRGGKSIWILTHDACEKIAIAENIRILRPEWLARGENGMWALEVRGYKNGFEHEKPLEAEMLWTTGEASEKNCKTDYPVAMAEKRAKDRLILKLVEAYQEGIYSEVEADDFKKER